MEKMVIYELHERQPLLAALTEVCEASVRATRTFLSEAELRRIKRVVPQALTGVAHLAVAACDGRSVGFLGAEGTRLEMLFLASEVRGMGLGRRLLEFSIARYGVRTLTVNEQNPQAVGFYEHMDFEPYRRTPCDEAGDPYPLLYMRRAEPGD